MVLQKINRWTNTIMSDEGRRFRNSLKGILIIILKMTIFIRQMYIYMVLFFFLGGDCGKWRSRKIKYDSALLPRDIYP